MSAFLHKLRSLLHRRSKEADLRDEVQFHLDEESDDLQARRLSPTDAYGAARRELGNVALIQEEARSAWTWTYLEQLVQDCRYGSRTILANKTFSLLAILSLALGIGASALFSSVFAYYPTRPPQTVGVTQHHNPRRPRPNSDVVIRRLVDFWGGCPTGSTFPAHVPSPTSGELEALAFRTPGTGLCHSGIADRLRGLIRHDVLHGGAAHR